MKLRIQKKPVLLVSVIAFVLLAAGLTWYYNSPDNLEYAEIGMKPTSDVADNIINSEENLKFGSFVKQVGYDNFLHGDGPYTIFVPTNAAYANLPTDTNFALLDPNDEGFLRQVVLYHVVKGKYSFADLKEGLLLTTVQGEKLRFTQDDGYWVINGYSYIETADVNSTNGIIHLTTNFLIPPSLLLDDVTTYEIE